MIEKSLNSILISSLVCVACPLSIKVNTSLRTFADKISVEIELLNIW